MKTSVETPFTALLEANGERPFEGWPQRWERVVLYVALASALMMFGGFVMTRLSADIRWHWLTLAAGGVCMLQGLGLSAVNLVGLALPTIRLLADPTTTLLTALDVKFRSERQQISMLAQRFDADQLDYSHARLCLSVEQIRSRASLIVGPVEKLGVIPTAVSGLAYLASLLGERKYDGTILPALFVAAVALYAWSARLMFVALRLDRIALIAQRAAAAGTKIRRQA